jgi:hypothetical protein
LIQVELRDQLFAYGTLQNRSRELEKENDKLRNGNEELKKLMREAGLKVPEGVALGGEATAGGEGTAGGEATAGGKGVRGGGEGVTVPGGEQVAEDSEGPGESDLMKEKESKKEAGEDDRFHREVVKEGASPRDHLLKHKEEDTVSENEEQAAAKNLKEGSNLDEDADGRGSGSAMSMAGVPPGVNRLEFAQWKNKMEADYLQKQEAFTEELHKQHQNLDDAKKEAFQFEEENQLLNRKIELLKKKEKLVQAGNLKSNTKSDGTTDGGEQLKAVGVDLMRIDQQLHMKQVLRDVTLHSKPTNAGDGSSALRTTGDPSTTTATVTPPNTNPEQVVPSILRLAVGLPLEDSASTIVDLSCLLKNSQQDSEQGVSTSSATDSTVTPLTNLLHAHFTKQEGELEEMKQELERKNEELDDKQKGLEKTSTDLEKANTDAAALRQDAAAVKEEFKGLKKAFDEQSAKLEETEARVKETEAKVKEWEAKVKEAEGKLKQQQEKSRQQQDELTQQQEKLRVSYRELEEVNLVLGGKSDVGKGKESEGGSPREAAAAAGQGHGGVTVIGGVTHKHTLGSKDRKDSLDELDKELDHVREDEDTFLKEDDADFTGILCAYKISQAI